MKSYSVSVSWYSNDVYFQFLEHYDVYIIFVYIITCEKSWSYQKLTKSLMISFVFIIGKNKLLVYIEKYQIFYI